MAAFIELLKKVPETAAGYTVSQIVAICGDGKLKDKSECSSHFREYLHVASSENLIQHANDCLQESFDHSGRVLQDIVNELGRRLDMKVEDGLYQGKPNAIGFDGLWQSANHSLVVEVKTTDVYRINLDDIAAYRDALQNQNRIGDASSILLVVGREDTGGLEAQIRGSRHAWIIRMISIDALGKLLQIKEHADEATIAKIHELLVPFEYTKLDRIVDFITTTAEEVTAAAEQESAAIDEDATQTLAKQDHTPKEVLALLRKRILAEISNKYGKALIKRSSASYWSPDKELRVVNTLAKRQKRQGLYWYAYHPQWDEFLSGAKEGLFVLGCVGRDEAFAIPYSWIHEQLPDLHTTNNAGKMYWHIHLEEQDDGKTITFKSFKTKKKLPLSQFRLVLPDVQNSTAS